MDYDRTTRDRRTNRRAVLGRSAAIGGALAAGHLGRASAQDATPVPLRQEHDVVYGMIDGTDLLLDVVRPPDRSDPRPAVILVHGGGLIMAGPGRFELRNAAMALAEAGYVTFNVDYRLFSLLKGTDPWPAQLDDVQRAVRWVRAKASTYGVDPDRIGAYGWSSGGQLGAFLGTRETRGNSDPELAGFSSKVTCVVTMGGTFDFTIPYQGYDSAPTDAQVMTGTADGTPTAEQIRDFSPLTFVDKTSAPFLVFQEGSEELVPYAHAQRLVAALQDARVQVSYSRFPDYEHVVWGYWPSSAPETLAFFGRHLEPER